MKVIEKYGYYELNLKDEEITYCLEMLLKTNTNLSINDIKNISEKVTKRLVTIIGPYPLVPTGNGSSPAEFYKQTRTYWYNICNQQIELEQLCKK